MNKGLIALLASITIAITTAQAEFVGPGAYYETTTIKALEKVQDDTEVTLVGHLTQKNSEEHYTFQDATGKIEVEIDNEDFRGVEVTPESIVRIVGEVEKEWSSVSIDVDKITVIG